MGLTVKDIIDYLTSHRPKIEKTVDTLKYGSPDMEVAGIVVTFMPTYDSIKRAVEVGANLMITHEGLFFSHWDNNGSENNQVYIEKRRLIQDSGMAIFRYHDYWHRDKPDGVTKGFVRAVGWETYVDQYLPEGAILNIPQMRVKDVATYVKGRLEIDYVRLLGDFEMPCSRIGVLPGYRGTGSVAIPFYEKYNLDLILYGEGPEWETPEYVRDAISQGLKKSLIILGHGESEEPGMKYLAELLNGKFPGIPIHYFSTNQRFCLI